MWVLGVDSSPFRLGTERQEFSLRSTAPPYRVTSAFQICHGCIWQELWQCSLSLDVPHCVIRGLDYIYESAIVARVVCQPADVEVRDGPR